jgi:hypothetical protein
MLVKAVLVESRRAMETTMAEKTLEERVIPDLIEARLELTDSRVAKPSLT